MLAFFLAVFYTWVLAAVDCFLRKKLQPFQYYLRIFVILYAVNMLIDINQAVANEINFEQWFDESAKISQYNRIALEGKIKYHADEGKFHFNKANKICLLIPDMTDSEKVDAMFRFVVVASLSIRDYSALVGLLIVSLTEYGLSIHKQWKRIEEHLMESKYHFEMAAFYRDVLDRDRILNE